ncbi:hypothetical protein GCM10010255_54320 [Streptomyces coeruleofuscus]|uniref:Uncharacterized protein n=1 Tax=Streptomyces coeruleofuscus TaxID=66879 RepID=A0ABP5VSM1_9ACTN
MPGFGGGQSRWVWEVFSEVRILRTRTSGWPWPRSCGGRGACGVNESGKAPGAGTPEDGTVLLYCARVTERYAERGVAGIPGEFRAIGNGCSDGEAPGRAGRAGRAGHGRDRASG